VAFHEENLTTSKNPVFIVASERSGTNLLRQRLTEAQDLYYGPSPAHLLKSLYFRDPYFGPLEDDKNFKGLIDAAVKLCTIHFAPWDIDWKIEDLLTEFGDRSRDALIVMDFLMEKYAREQGRERYISKENFLYEFALDIAARLPGAKFIYLYRDPRDVVVSQCKRQSNSLGVYRFAKLWEYEQTRAIRVHQILAKQGLSVAVSYEDLVSNEEKVIQRLVDFLGTERSETVEQFSERVAVVPHEWVNLSSGTMRDNFGKYRRELSKRQIKVVEAMCHLQMSQLGYKPDIYAPGQSMRYAFLLDRTIQNFDRVRVRLTGGRNKSPIFRKRSRLLGQLKTNYRSDH